MTEKTKHFIVSLIEDYMQTSSGKERGNWDDASDALDELQGISVIEIG